MRQEQKIYRAMQGNRKKFPGGNADKCFNQMNEIQAAKGARSAVAAWRLAVKKFNEAVAAFDQTEAEKPVVEVAASESWEAIIDGQRPVTREERRMNAGYDALNGFVKQCHASRHKGRQTEGQAVEPGSVVSMSEAFEKALAQEPPAS